MVKRKFSKKIIFIGLAYSFVRWNNRKVGYKDGYEAGYNDGYNKRGGVEEIS